MADPKDSIEERLNRHPDLKKRIDELLKIVENAEGDIQKASEAEQMVIEELRKMGNDVLRNWAENREKQASEKFSNMKDDYKSNGKKK
jgi:23S rRNA pseudoU1915 N3-methylase RlmH